MILRDLCDLYDLKRSGGSDDIPERFWCKKQVSWEIVLSKDGEIRSCIALCAEGGKRPQTLVVPDVQRTSGVRAFFMCDNAEYVFAYDAKKGPTKQASFIELHRSILNGLSDGGALAFLRFVDRLSDQTASPNVSFLREDTKSLIVFRLEHDDCLIHERAAVHDAWNARQNHLDNGMPVGTCLVSGEREQYAKLFPQVTGLPGAQSSGASLVSCNVSSFGSYGQKISTAGPISQEAADKAGAALAYVLKSRDHSVRVGSDLLGFWTDAETPETNALFSSWFTGRLPQEDGDVRDAVKDALDCIRRGRKPVSIPSDTRYHLLGIAPYQGRLAVRFYETDSLGNLMESIKLFLQDTEMIGVERCSIRSIMEQTAAQGKADNISSALMTSTMRAMLKGSAFPAALYQQILLRMRADHGSNNVWDAGQRAAILRACLIREVRRRSTSPIPLERSITVSLNEQNTNEGYLLGRLFAILEKIQSDANGDTNATIRDRYMSAAATTPARVFPQLMRLSTHHLKKIEQVAFKVVSDRRIQEVMELVGDRGFPKTLSYDDQGCFYIGYYQQKRAFYTKSEDE